MTQETARRSVLIADDDEVLRQAMVEVLEEEGHLLHQASNGAVALEKALLIRPDVVVVDYMMPIASGAAFIESLRAIVRPAPAIVAISGFPGAARWCAENGVEVFLAKPFLLASFLHAVEHACDRTQDASPSSSSGLRIAVRTACIMAVGEGAEDLNATLPTAIRHARVVVVDSPDEAMQILREIVPELVVLGDDPSHQRLRRYAEARGIPCISREDARPSRRENGTR